METMQTVNLLIQRVSQSSSNTSSDFADFILNFGKFRLTLWVWATYVYVQLQISS